MKEMLAGLSLIAAIALLFETAAPGSQWMQAILGGTAAAATISFTVSAAVDRVWKKAKDGSITKTGQR